MPDEKIEAYTDPAGGWGSARALIDILTREEIQNSSPSNNIADFVNQLPALAGSTRPANSLLSHDAITRDYGIHPPAWQTALGNILDELLGASKKDISQ